MNNIMDFLGCFLSLGNRFNQNKRDGNFEFFYSAESSLVTPMCNTKGLNKCLTPGVSSDDTKNFAAAMAGCSHDSSGWKSEPGIPG